MEKQQTKIARSSRALIIVGFASIAISFLAYWNNEYLTVTPAAMPALQRLAVTTYVILFLAFGAIGIGLYRFHKAKVAANNDSMFSIISNAINSKRSKQIFVASAIGYGLFFAFTSGTILYKPTLFATQYGLAVPSIELSPCCGAPGYMPMILAMFTEHVGLQIIPLNFVLIVTVSFLVGLNFALSYKTFSMARGTRSLGTFGAVTGLFVCCPTCAGTAFTLLFGLGAGATGTGLTLFLTTIDAQLQTIFIAISIPVLLVTPFIMARNIRKSQSGNCPVDFKKS